MELPGPSSRTSSARLFSGRILVVVLGLVVIAVPVLAAVVDDKADRVETFSIVLWAGWAACALLAAIVLTHALRMSGPEATPGLALAYDALPVLLIVGWIVLVASLLTGHWLLAVAAACLCGYHLTLVVPRFVADPVPRWARNAPRLSLCVANVYIDNPTPDAAAGALVACGADVIVIVESNPKFMAAFDSAGGTETHPYRLFDPDDNSEYAVTIASRLELLDESQVSVTESLRCAIAVVRVGSRPTTIVGLNAMATVETNGYRTWGQQIEELMELIPSFDGPLVIAGDLNATGYRPEFRALLRTGLRDAHDSLGKGLNPSFKLSNSGPLGVGPIVRLDHALIGHGVCALEVGNLPPNGSDHLPFHATLAIQQLHRLPLLQRPKRRRAKQTARRLRLRSRSRSTKRRSAR